MAKTYLQIGAKIQIFWNSENCCKMRDFLRYFRDFQFTFIRPGKNFSNNSSLLTRLVMVYQYVPLTFIQERKITYRSVYNLVWPLFGGLNFHTTQHPIILKVFWTLLSWKFMTGIFLRKIHTVVKSFLGFKKKFFLFYENYLAHFFSEKKLKKKIFLG